jgi:hypothetical protein
MAVKASNLTSEELVLAILEHPSKLDAGERAAFEGMGTQLRQGRALTDKQKHWARRVFDLHKIGEVVDRDNLASVNRISGQKVDASSASALDKMLGPKVPIPPPTRKRNY